MSHGLVRKLAQNLMIIAPPHPPQPEHKMYPPAIKWPRCSSYLPRFLPRVFRGLLASICEPMAMVLECRFQVVALAAMIATHIYIYIYIQAFPCFHFLRDVMRRNHL